MDEIKKAVRNLKKRIERVTVYLAVANNSIVGISRRGLKAFIFFSHPERRP